VAVTLRPATVADIPLLCGWDAEPDVVASGAARGPGVWRDELARSVSWAEELIAEADGVPVGFMQLIDAAAEETHYWGADVEPGAWAMDIWVGAPEHRGRGIGREMMRLALDRCFDVHGATAVLLDPRSDNTRAHRFYERLGFCFVERRMFDDDDVDCFVYRLGRDER